MNTDTLPPELARRWGHLQFVRKRGSEYSAECPSCGDSGHMGRDWPDRFRMWTEPARGWCRVCGFQDFADSDKPNVSITEEVRERWIAERLEREQQARQEAEHAIALLQQEQSWMQYEQQITEEMRAWWERKGVPAYLQSYFHLGYCLEKSVWFQGQRYVTPTATIPVFAPDWQVVNVRHRLLHPPNPGDKYRPERKGLPTALYLTNPDEKPQGETILVEGEIKSIVVFDRLDDPQLTIVGLPGKTASAGLLDSLADCDPIHIVLDPDAKVQAFKYARHFTDSGQHASVVQLPVKADDLFTMHAGSTRDFRLALRQGRTI